MELHQAVSQLLKLHTDDQTKECIVAYSGGVDSHVLLHLMTTVVADFPQLKLSAVHINHAINVQADNWQHHCEDICQQLGVPLKVAKLQLRKHNRQSLEALAREQRYAAIHNLAAQGALVLLAQHQDDQLETFLLQLKRGAGPKGLSAMGAHSVNHGLAYLRPLLPCSRQQIMAYAQQYKLQWVEDGSNQDIDFDRNFLRQQILPQLVQRWPQLAMTASRSAALCAQQQALLDEVCQQRLQPMVREKGQLDIRQLQHYSPDWQQQLVRLWLAQQQVSMPSHRQLLQLETVVNARADASPILRWQHWQLRRFADSLYLLRDSDVSDVNLTEQRLSLGRNIILATGGVLHLSDRPEPHLQPLFNPTPQQPLTLRYGLLSQKFKPQGQSYSKALKQWFKLWQIPPWQRRRLPLLCSADSILAVILPGQIVLANYSEKTLEPAIWLGQ